MKHRLRRAVTLLLGAVLAVSLILIVRQENDYRTGQRDYLEAEALSGLPPVETEPTPETDPYLEQLAALDLESLRAVNSDVVGWIEIPGTEVSYPLLQGDDNQYYLNRTWKRERSSVGAIYLDCQVSAELDDFNTLIYGHRMRDGSMFGGLRHYKELSYWEAHPSVYVATDEMVRRYDIYAAYEPGTTDITFRLNLQDQESREEFLRHGMEGSVIETGLRPTVVDRVLTLTTCTGRGYSTRWVVQAALAAEFPGGAE